jgi:preprotein translocase subunit Sec63
MCPLQPSKLGHFDPLEKLSISKKTSKKDFYKNPKVLFYGPSKD